MKKLEKYLPTAESLNFKIYIKIKLIINIQSFEK